MLRELASKPQLCERAPAAVLVAAALQVNQSLRLTVLTVAALGVSNIVLGHASVAGLVMTDECCWSGYDRRVLLVWL